MNNRNTLKQLVEQKMIPAVENYLEEFHQLMAKDKLKKDDMDEIRDFESFLLELENIVLAINQNKISEDKAQEIYEKIIKLNNKENHKY